MGFRSNRDLQKHKYEEHDGYCKLCDVDTENFQTLIEHKNLEIRHISCEICGRDFKSSAGRDRHQLKVRDD